MKHYRGLSSTLPILGLAAAILPSGGAEPQLMLLLRRDNTQHTVLHPHMPPSSANIDTRKSAIRMFKRHGQGQRIASMSMHNTTVSVFMPLNIKSIFLLVFFCTDCGSGFSDIYPLGSMVGVTKNLKLPSPSLCSVGSGPVT